MIELKFGTRSLVEGCLKFHSLESDNNCGMKITNPGPTNIKECINTVLHHGNHKKEVSQCWEIVMHGVFGFTNQFG